jgi:hypothetical protein
LNRQKRSFELVDKGSHQQRAELLDLSHNGMDIDLKMASRVRSIGSIILGGKRAALGAGIVL